MSENIIDENDILLRTVSYCTVLYTIVEPGVGLFINKK